MPLGAHPDRPLLTRWLRQDVGLLLGAAGTSLVGALLVWSATHEAAGTAYLARHLLNTVIGIALAVAVTRLGHHGLRLVAPWIYGVSLLGLVVVLTPLGLTVNGSRSWIPVAAGFTVQPSEFAKVGLVLVLAFVFAERWERRVAPTGRDVALGWALAAVPVALIMLQPDLGSAVVLGALAFVVIAVAGASRRWIAGIALAATGVVVAALTTPLLSDYQRNRLLAFADTSADPEGIGYQTRQVRLAIGSGGWTGQGFMEGRQTQGGFIPYQLNDFIFSVAGEELGFVGAAGLLALLSFIVIRIFVVAGRSPYAFGRFVGIGVGTWLAFQVFQNVGMNLGVMPVTGLPLPFISYGGSSMFASWLAVGVVNAAYAAGQREGRRT
ncbi:FtsW/RodA/SpoVE family cell cycle protein [Knoellia aerolata]|uniref:peptidoglycan glycosyltransferase n=1 Tax=Knoellia aerolata DSM 18566 TaxID=1385519 RepID=A0A0A0JVL2_9MICO|nr:FtsW/RodA/SpoVE family cell cycle protein [Knoellia aerolata]KGN39671.1 cell division protein [Knoellia aerolata DSM 18566]